MPRFCALDTNRPRVDLRVVLRLQPTAECESVNILLAVPSWVFYFVCISWIIPRIEHISYIVYGVHTYVFCVGLSP